MKQIEIFATSMRPLLLFIFTSFSLALNAQPYRVVVKDLAQQWMIQDGNDWRAPLAGEAYNSVYLMLDATSARGNYLEVTGIEPYSIWCNGRLIGNYKSTSRLAIDSLAALYSTEMKFAIVAPGSAPYLNAQLVRFSPEDVEEDIRVRKKPFFLNFSILVTFILGAYFIVLFQSNPRLILDYFNFAKLFSIQERDENLTAGRITSSINLVMYIFICLCLSFLLVVVFHFTPQRWVASRVFSFSSEWRGLAVWLELSMFLLLAIFSKMILLFISTQVFKFKEGYAIQALNFFRLLIFISVVFAMVVSIYFMARVTKPSFYSSLISILGWILSGWVLLLFLKLLNKAPFTGFHLFFYLCASEIFPLVICFQILFF